MKYHPGDIAMWRKPIGEIVIVKILSLNSNGYNPLYNVICLDRKDLIKPHYYLRESDLFCLTSNPVFCDGI